MRGRGLRGRKRSDTSWLLATAEEVREEKGGSELRVSTTTGSTEDWEAAMAKGEGRRGAEVNGEGEGEGEGGQVVGKRQLLRQERGSAGGSDHGDRERERESRSGVGEASLEKSKKRRLDGGGEEEGGDLQRQRWILGMTASARERRWTARKSTELMARKATELTAKEQRWWRGCRRREKRRPSAAPRR